jgi:ATP-dependent DNA helicase RecQ
MGAVDTTTAERLIVTLAGPDAVLRPDQLTAIEALVGERARVLVVQRTGWGKSAVYWIATKLLRDQGAGPTLVVSPLLALMRDQIAAAARMGLRARTINSTNVEAWNEVNAELAAGAIDVLLVSPERLNNPFFRFEVLPQLTAGIGFLVIDEAHSISDWGHDFRPDYRRLVSVIADLPAGAPVLATTATANERVTQDIASQIGDTTLTLRGSLDRDSLALSVVDLPDAARRLGFVTETIRGAHTSGILYCLTVSEAERVAEFLTAQGIAAASYTGSTEPDERERTEAALKANELDVVVATSALGMGYDKPDLGFVIHLGSPSSPVAYYQQVGRAGRALDSAAAILLPTPADRDIWAYFDSTAFPPRHLVERVIEAVAVHGPISTPALEQHANLRRSRLEGLLKVLDVEGAVVRTAAGWQRTDGAWTYDVERLATVAAHRAAEQEAMVTYAHLTTCRMRFLREALDDVAEDCGRCDVCTGVAPTASVSPELAAAALAHLRDVEVPIEPRKRWPNGVRGRSGAVAPDARAAEGRALSFLGDPGWGPALTDLLAGGARVPDDVYGGVLAALKRWPWGQRPTWITTVPSRRHPGLLADLATRLAADGKLELVDALVRVTPDAPRQAEMANSSTQAANVIGAFELTGVALPRGPGLLLDDTVRSGWTLTVAAELLRGAGAEAVLPFVLARV